MSRTWQRLWLCYLGSSNTRASSGHQTKGKSTSMPHSTLHDASESQVAVTAAILEASVLKLSSVISHQPGCVVLQAADSIIIAGGATPLRLVSRADKIRTEYVELSQWKNRGHRLWTSHQHSVRGRGSNCYPCLVGGRSGKRNAGKYHGVRSSSNSSSSTGPADVIVAYELHCGHSRLRPS